jgi:hypothetical protein
MKMSCSNFRNLMVVIGIGSWVVFASSAISQTTPLKTVNQAGSTPNATVAVITPSPAVLKAQALWLEGAEKAAAGFGCASVSVQQQANETVTEAIKIFALKGVQGSCLVLAPIATTANTAHYSFAFGGQSDGVDIFYLSDVGRMRIWNGMPVDGD